MKRQRDSQRNRCYKAEREMNRAMPHVTERVGKGKMSDVEAYVYSVYNDPWLRAKYPRAVLPQELVLHDGRGTKGAAAWQSNHLQFPRCHRRKIYILHEIAHLLTYHARLEGREPGHGGRWCATFLDLVLHFLGFEEFLALRQAFIANNCRITP